jgi:beta-D-xylosidase 4
MGLDVTYALGTSISTSDTSHFADAVSAAEASDVIVFVGGIDNTVEGEARDRVNITWPGNQLELVQRLSALGKPLVVLQMGGGQIDDSALVKNANVSSLVWGGYPGQDGGTALLDILVGNAAPAGRLPVTQYPASYVDEIAMTNMVLRPTNGSPGRTYKWYTGTPIFEFGFGAHYTTFSKTLTISTPDSLELADSTNHTATAVSATAAVTNSGNVTSDYVALVFMTTTNAGPAPFPKKTLVGYQRLGAIAPGETRSAVFDLPYERFSRVDEKGNSLLHPGDFVLSLDVDGEAHAAFTMTGSLVMIDEWPQPS